ncbi:hypothetical protein EON64_07695 [archaeon]|nr:MAG: hypothetical protein EON64_07695 [archaeon]
MASRLHSYVLPSTSWLLLIRKLRIISRPILHTFLGVKLRGHDAALLHHIHVALCGSASLPAPTPCCREGSTQKECTEYT